MKTIFDLGARKELLERVNNLRPDLPRQFGSMNAPQALHHVNGAFELYLGEITAPYNSNALKSAVFRLFTFSPFPIPKGKGRTAPALIASGTYDLEQEKRHFAELIERVGVKSPQSEWPVHPLFGKLSGKQYGTLGYKHTDHHLKQFGV